jgi:hypothetical protein
MSFKKKKVMQIIDITKNVNVEKQLLAVGVVFVNIIIAAFNLLYASALVGYLSGLIGFCAFLESLVALVAHFTEGRGEGFRKKIVTFLLSATAFVAILAIVILVAITPNQSKISNAW